MKKLNYYTAIEISYMDGKEYRMSLNKKMENGDWTSHFKTLEEAKQQIEYDHMKRQHKDTTRTYADGSKVKLSFNDKYDLKYIIRKHYEEIEEVDEYDFPKTYHEEEKPTNEELDVM